MNNMEIMTKWVSRQVEQSSKFRKWSHLTVMQPLKPGKHSTAGISQYNDSQNQDLSTVWLVCMHYVWECIRVSVWGCPVQLLSDPSFLLFSNPSCMGQRTERASIWAPSPAYLLDTQVGNDSSGPLLPPPPRLFFFKFFHRVDCVRSVFVTWPDYHCGILHFHLWELFMQTQLSCSVLCVHIWGAGALGLLSELACHVPYHTLCFDCVKLGCQWICVCHFVPCWLLYILFFSWGGAVQPC